MAPYGAATGHPESPTALGRDSITRVESNCGAGCPTWHDITVPAGEPYGRHGTPTGLPAYRDAAPAAPGPGRHATLGPED
ncbi:hypothetical protein ACIRPP_11755 [Streptomyces sp. NPDC101219]|uniref:hypothetical protein n=1 Tax=Streptomyces sp. NPDC101219 TaxID=3366131 RepID=UPI003828474A